MFAKPLLASLHHAGIVAVLIIDNSNDAVPVAKALLAGGVKCIELTLRTAAAMESLRRIRTEVPEMIAGAGTILTVKQVAEAKAVGADFGVAPGMNSRTVKKAERLGLPFAPGVCTPSDIEQALQCGCRLLKFFPAEPLGGIAYLRNIAAPFAHLDLRFIPLGGIDDGNAEQYLGEPHILALGGSWIAPRDLIQKQDWPTITRRARQAAILVEKARPRGER